MSFSKVKPTEYFGPHVLSEDAHAEKVFQPEYCPSQGKWNWKFSTDRKVKVTRPSILCVTQKRAFMPLYIVLGQHRACMPVYIGKSGDLVGWHRCLTDTQTTEYRATQLLSSIQFKLSHAIAVVRRWGGWKAVSLWLWRSWLSRGGSYWVGTPLYPFCLWCRFWGEAQYSHLSLEGLLRHSN